MFENVGSGEILLILLVILIFFGPKKIPELAQSLGKGIRKFNDAKSGLETQVKTAMKEPLEAITGAKDGFEAKMRELAEPLHAELKLPATTQATASTPTPAQSPESQPRITSGAEPTDPETPKIPEREA